MEDYRGALRDFEVALATGALPPERNNQLRYFIAQIYFQLEDYAAAIRGLNEWIRIAQQTGAKVDCNAYYLLGAAYTQISPPNYNAAKGPGEQAIACAPTPKKGYYDLLNLIYSEANDNAKRAALLEKMINFWPGERGYWTQLSGLYSTMGRDGEAFSVLEVAYRAGLLTKENEIMTLVQYYSFYDNPYRGAKLLEREMATGTVAENVKNLTLLSQLWSQAREHKRAIPVLEKASRMDSKGELSYRLGQVLVADEQYVAAERALSAALQKGGMTATQTGDCALLLGTAIFSQAGPGDHELRQRARRAFVRATNYPSVSGQARRWVEYIDAIDATECAQDRLECQQKDESRVADIERLKQQAQVCRLQGRDDCDSILAQVKELEAQTFNCANVCKRPDAPTAEGAAGEPEMTPAPEGSGLNEPEGAAIPDARPEPAEAPKLDAPKPTAVPQNQ
jgi:tetratricopeptide (TPR) repeat protein